MKKVLLPVLMVCIVMLLASCTAQPHDISNCVANEPAGFWLGLWHGCIAPFAFIVSLFYDSVTVFEVNNTGGWYIFGFLLGIGAFTSGGTKGASRARRKRHRGDWN